MSSQQPFSASVGEVHHVHKLSDHIGILYQNKLYSDVTLIVEGSRFASHRVILAARSEYFRALLYGGLKESHLSEVELKDAPLKAFEILLKYIYTGHMTLTGLKDQFVLELLGLAHQYGFQELETAVSDYLRSMLNVANCCRFSDTASMYNLEKLSSACSVFMDLHAQDIVEHESFLNFSENGVRTSLIRNSFCCPESQIFKAVVRWMKVNSRSADDSIISVVRLSLMSTSDVLQIVRPTNLVHPDVMLDAIRDRTELRDSQLPYRGHIFLNENVATPKRGSRVLIGEVKQALLDGDSTNYDMEKGFSRHIIDESPSDGIVVKLGVPCIINHIKMLLWDRDQRAYSYYIDVSMDQLDWVNIVDYSSIFCRSWQFLYFHPRSVQYIRVVGTHNTVNKVFHIVALEAYYTSETFKLDPQGFVVPRSNMAAIDKYACVIEGVCRSRNALLNGNTSQYDWDSGYTCHQLGSGAIVVQLSQPYAVSSMSLLLWDCDDRVYGFYIEVSLDNKLWEMVCDRSNGPCRGWQTITFEQRPVVLIRIVGTKNTANEVFHCVHFECPSVSIHDSCGYAGTSASLSPIPAESVYSVRRPTSENSSFVEVPRLLISIADNEEISPPPSPPSPLYMEGNDEASGLQGVLNPEYYEFYSKEF